MNTNPRCELRELTPRKEKKNMHPGNVTVENHKTFETVNVSPDRKGGAVLEINGETFTVSYGNWRTVKAAVDAAMLHVKS